LNAQDKAIETLTGLGLTVLQAKIYIVLAKAGKSTIKDIAKTSRVARQDLYRIATQLLNLGLIEKLIGTPTKFEAIPIQEAINMLVERRKKETDHLEKGSTEFLRFFAENKGVSSKEEEPQYIIINDLQARLIRAKKQIVNSKESLKIVTKWSFFLTYTLETIEEHLIAMNNGAKVKIVTQQPNSVVSLPKSIQKLMAHPNFEVRYVHCLPSSIVAIFDEKEVNILLATDKSPAETSLLMTDNSVLIELACNYFQIMWANAIANAMEAATEKEQQLRNENFSTEQKRCEWFTN
jgi:sugar-specific transcriptional regulator TrmB